MQNDLFQRLLACAAEMQWAISMQPTHPKLALLGEMDQRMEMLDLVAQVRQGFQR